LTTRVGIASNRFRSKQDAFTKRSVAHGLKGMRGVGGVIVTRIRLKGIVQANIACTRATFAAGCSQS
jgi:hypothetical protein